MYLNNPNSFRKKKEHFCTITTTAVHKKLKKMEMIRNQQQRELNLVNKSTGDLNCNHQIWGKPKSLDVLVM